MCQNNYAPKKTKIGFKYKNNEKIQPYVTLMYFFFRTVQANSTYHTKKSKTAVTATGATRGS